MRVFLTVFTYFAYVFIVVMYAAKIIRYLRLPVHLRWELYPIVHEERSHYGGSYQEKALKVPGARWRSFMKELAYLSKDYLFMVSYFKWRKSYWVFLYLSHVSSVLLILFQSLLLAGAVVEAARFHVSAASTHSAVIALYWLTIVAGLTSFMTGLAGNVGLFIKRLTDPDLKGYATPLMYMGYIFSILICLSGLFVWHSIDVDFSQLRAFWVGLVRLAPAEVGPEVAVFVVLLNLHLIYLPFTRATHYITRLFAYFLIRWDDEPNVRGGNLEKEVIRLENQEVTWEGPHIGPGHKWSDLVK